MRPHSNILMTLALLLLATAAFAQTGTVAGIVRLPGENGAPAVGANIVLSAEPFDTLYAMSDSAGSFTITQVPVGSFHIRAYLTGYQTAEATGRVTANATTTVNLHLGGAPATLGGIQGIVFLPADAGPAAGATVVLRHGLDSVWTVTDANGHYAIDSLIAWDYAVRATLGTYRPAEAVVHIITGMTVPLNLFLRPALTGFGTVNGVVRLPGPGDLPAVGAAVLMCNEAFDTLRATTGTNGGFEFSNVTPGEYHLRATLTGYQAGDGQVWVSDGQTAHVTIVLRGLPTGGGTVDGVVIPGAAVNDTIMAEVQLAGHGEHAFFQTHTTGDGHFVFVHVPAGPYTITASWRMHGFASSSIVVTENQTTHVTLELSDSAGPGHQHGDTLTVVDLQGTAVLTYPDSINHPNHVRYGLDVDGDGVADYRLSFGPPWYQPANGAHRPNAGDQITIHGGLLTYTDPPIVVVYEINGLLWREPFHGHGGHPGGDHHRRGCNPDSVTAVEFSGQALVTTGQGPHGEVTLYAIDTDANSTPNFVLDFGRPDYAPSNGAQRPANGDSIAIVGGQIFCPNAPIPVVIVYEINGLYWREPGDTLGLGAESESVSEPVNVGQPVSYITSRNYPNPFNPTTTIAYSVPGSGLVKLSVFDITGRKVSDLVSGYQHAGSYVVSFDGHALPSGIYFCRLTQGNLSFTNRMLLLK
jgi:hypothetical protein